MSTPQLPPGAVRCFLLTPVQPGRAARSLRRYSRDYNAGMCGGRGFHNASVRIGDEAYPLADERNGTGYEAEDDEKADVRWPTTCEWCGAYAFLREDRWQVNVDRLFARSDGGAPMTLAEARKTPGAMWDCGWNRGLAGYTPGPDGRILCVTTPGEGEWVIDGPASDGGRWTRTGDAPNLTVTPSIVVGGVRSAQRYHGWLRDGVLVPA